MVVIAHALGKDLELVAAFIIAATVVAIAAVGFFYKRPARGGEFYIPPRARQLTLWCVVLAVVLFAVGLVFRHV